MLLFNIQKINIVVSMQTGHSCGMKREFLKLDKKILSFCTFLGLLHVFALLRCTNKENQFLTVRSLIRKYSFYDNGAKNATVVVSQHLKLLFKICDLEKSLLFPWLSSNASALQYITVSSYVCVFWRSVLLVRRLIGVHLDHV